jgi:sugar lactone lactonase YvrE
MMKALVVKARHRQPDARPFVSLPREGKFMTRSLVTMTVVLTWAFFLLTAEVAAHPAWGIAVDRQGQVYFTDLKTVWKIDAQGTLSVFRKGDDRHTHELNIDEAGNIYGADNSYEPATQRFFSSIWKMTPTGSFSYLLPPTEYPPKGTSIWRDRDGNTYHATSFPERELLVLKRAPDGRVTVLAGKSNAASEYRQQIPYSLGGMAFGADGALYFVHGASISKLTTSGTLTALANNLLLENASGNPTGAGSPTQLFGIAVDAEGNAFIADHGNRRVIKINPGNQITTLIRAEEPWFPTGVALRGSELYILEYGQTRQNIPVGTRVRKLSPDGKVVTLATLGENGRTQAGPTATESSTGGGSRGLFEPGHIPYALIGAGTGIIALIIIIWLARKRIYDRQHGNT